MNRLQAVELHTLISTVRHVKEMDQTKGACHSRDSIPACLLCEGVRYGLYNRNQGRNLDHTRGFSDYFGCNKDEARRVLFHYTQLGKITSGELYYQAGHRLIEKYGHGDLFTEKGKSFAEIMDEIKQPVVQNV